MAGKVTRTLQNKFLKKDILVCNPPRIPEHGRNEFVLEIGVSTIEVDVIEVIRSLGKDIEECPDAADSDGSRLLRLAAFVFDHRPCKTLTVVLLVWVECASSACRRSDAGHSVGDRKPECDNDIVL